MKYKISFVCVDTDKDWPHYQWNIEINGEHFYYKTGLGHSTSYWKNPKVKVGTKAAKPDRECIPNFERQEWIHIPSIDEVLNSLFMDAMLGNESFDDFCDNSGYSNDSLKALNVRVQGSAKRMTRLNKILDQRK